MHSFRGRGRWSTHGNGSLVAPVIARADNEAVEAAGGGHTNNGYPFDDGARRPGPQQMLDPIEFQSGAFCYGSNGPIPVVRDPARKAEPPRLSHDEVAEPDTLDAAANDGLQADEIIHSGSGPTTRPGKQEDIERELRTHVGIDQLRGPVEAREEWPEPGRRQVG